MELIAATARAFERPCPETVGSSAPELLLRAIGFSRTCAVETMRGGGDLGRVEHRLFSEAFALGRRVRDRLGVANAAEGLAAAQVVYRAIGIEFRPRPMGDVVVVRCAFARVYGPGVCRLMSSMDSGLIAGLTDAGGLRFTERITEGASACRALLLAPGDVA
jgi:hypothetical protein